MAHLHPYYGLHKEFLSWRYTYTPSSRGGNHHGQIGLIPCSRKTRENSDLSLNNNTKVSGVQLQRHCCSSSPPGNELEVISEDVFAGNGGIHSRSTGDQVGLLLSNEYGWEVRRLVETEDEMRKVAQIQAEAFYEPAIFFDEMFFEFFKVLI